MSVSRPARCLFMAPSNPFIRPRIQCQNFHTSLSLCARRRSKSKKALAMSTDPVDIQYRATKHFPKYSEEEKELLRKKYTPEQMDAIEAGEAAINPKDLETRAVIRSDMGTLSYLDDMSKIRPTIDRKYQYEGPRDPDERLMTEKELDAAGDLAIEKMFERLPPMPEDKKNDEEWLLANHRPNRADWLSAVNPSITTGRFGPVPIEHQPSPMAPALPTTFLDDENDDGKKRKKKKDKDEEEEADPRDPDGQYNKLIKKSGLNLDQILDFKTKILVRHRVVNQTRLGKVASIYCLAIAGNGDGRLGIGEAKGQETEDTSTNAKIAAILAMQPIPRYENRTIYGDIEGKVSAAVVQLMARPPGFGLRCQHNIFEMARAAGIHDLAARVPRSRNKMNTVKATYQALMKQRLPDEIAMGRGKKLVDVRKVYYAGRV